MKDKRQKPDATALTPGARFSAPKRPVAAHSRAIVELTSVATSKDDIVGTPSGHDATTAPRLGRSSASRGRVAHRTGAIEGRPRSVRGHAARNAVSAILGVALVGGSA